VQRHRRPHLHVRRRRDQAIRHFEHNRGDSAVVKVVDVVVETVRPVLTLRERVLERVERGGVARECVVDHSGEGSNPVIIAALTCRARHHAGCRRTDAGMRHPAHLEYLDVRGRFVTHAGGRVGESHRERNVLVSVQVGVDVKRIDRFVAERGHRVRCRSRIHRHHHHGALRRAGEEIHIGQIQPRVLTTRRGVEMMRHDASSPFVGLVSHSVQRTYLLRQADAPESRRISIGT